MDRDSPPAGKGLRGDDTLVDGRPVNIYQDGYVGGDLRMWSQFEDSPYDLVDCHTQLVFSLWT